MIMQRAKLKNREIKNKINHKRKRDDCRTYNEEKNRKNINNDRKQRQNRKQHAKQHKTKPNQVKEKKKQDK